MKLNQRKSRARRGRRGPPKAPLALVNRRLTNTTPRMLGQPARKTVWLEYHANYPLGAAADQTYLLPLYASAPFSPDPFASSLTTPTFAFNANGYTYYRVDQIEVRVEYLNRETFGGQGYIFLRDTSLGATVGGDSYLNIQEVASQGIVSSGFMGNASSQPKAVTRLRSTVSAIVGENVNYDTLYRSLVNSIPSNLVWLLLGLQMDSAVSEGVSSYVFLKMRTIFDGFVGIAVTLEELGMCGGCRFINLGLNRGTINHCCSVRRSCNNCGAQIPCCRGEGVVANPGCTIAQEDARPELHHRVEPYVGDAIFTPRCHAEHPSKLQRDKLTVPSPVSTLLDRSVVLGVLDGRELKLSTKIKP